MKFYLMRFWPYFLGIMVGFMLVFGGLAAFATAVRAASYNVIFNNIEQGPNSTANPSVHVSGGKVTKSPGTNQATEEHSINLDQPTPAAMAAPVATTTATRIQEPALASDDAGHRFRLGFGGFALNNTHKLAEASSAKLGGAISASISILKDFAITGFTGLGTENDHYAGGELEFVPLRISIFGLNNLVEAGFMAGANTMAKDDSSWGSVHGGARVSLNLGERFGIAGDVRSNLTERTSFSYWLASAGLTVRL